MRRRHLLAVALITSVLLAATPASAITGVYGGGGTSAPPPKPVPLPPHLQPTPVTSPPADVPADHWASSAINQLRTAGLMIGDPDGNFRPDAQVSTAETIMVFLRLLGFSPKVGVDGQHWADPALELARSVGWIGENQAKRPDDGMDRVGVALVLARALKIEPVSGSPPWSDVSGLPPEALGYLVALYQKGLFMGYPDGTFRPDRVVTRAEIAVLVSRILAGIR